MAIQEYLDHNIQTPRTEALPDLCDIRIFCTTKQIDYPGVNNFTQFAYNGWGKNTKIVETVSGSMTSTKQLVWCANSRREERNASGTLVKQFFGRGEKVSGVSFYFAADHQDSLRELTDASGIVLAEFKYDSFGIPQVIQQTVLPDFLYAGYFYHERSALNLTRTRSYHSKIGRFTSRDAIQDGSRFNLFAYVSNSPIGFVDPSGLEECPCDSSGGAGSSGGDSGSGGESGGNDPELIAQNDRDIEAINRTQDMQDADTARTNARIQQKMQNRQHAQRAIPNEGGANTPYSDRGGTNPSSAGAHFGPLGPTMGYPPQGSGVPNYGPGECLLACSNGYLVWHAPLTIPPDCKFCDCKPAK